MCHPWPACRDSLQWAARVRQTRARRGWTPKPLAQSSVFALSPRSALSMRFALTSGEGSYRGTLGLDALVRFGRLCHHGLPTFRRASTAPRPVASNTGAGGPAPEALVRSPRSLPTFREHASAPDRCPMEPSEITLDAPGRRSGIAANPLPIAHPKADLMNLDISPHRTTVMSISGSMFG